MTNIKIPNGMPEGSSWVACIGGCGDEYRPHVLIRGMCRDCNDIMEAEEKADRLRQVLIDERESIIRSMLDVRGYEEYRFDKFVPHDESSASALEVAKEFDPVLHDLFLCGPTGTGKSHLAGAIFRTRAPKLESIGAPDFEFARAIDIIRKFRSRKYDEDQLMQRYATLRLLVIDDLGAEKTTDHVNQIIYEIFDRRMMAKRHGMIVTSNLGLSDIAEQSGTDRATSRLNLMCQKIYLCGKDMRMKGPNVPKN